MKDCYLIPVYTTDPDKAWSLHCDECRGTVKADGSVDPSMEPARGTSPEMAAVANRHNAYAHGGLQTPRVWLMPPPRHQCMVCDAFFVPDRSIQIRGGIVNCDDCAAYADEHEALEAMAANLAEDEEAKLWPR